MKSKNKISSSDDKKKFFRKIFVKLKKNYLFNRNLHLLMGTNVFENSLFKNNDLYNCLNNKKKKVFFS